MAYSSVFLKMGLGELNMEIFNKKSTLEKRKLLRINQTEAEKRLWQYLRNRKLNGYKFFRQYGLGDYIVDFYCPKIKLVIELDGVSHFTCEGIKYDEIRTNFFSSFGVEVIRFKNSEIINNIEACLNRILGKIDK